MLDRDRIREMFGLFSDLPDEALPNWEGLREAAARRLEGRLRPDADIAGEMEALCITAAALAYADWLLLTGSGAGASEEIQVGDIRLKNAAAQTGADAAELRAYFLDSVAHLLVPETPALRAVGPAEVGA